MRVLPKNVGDADDETGVAEQVGAIGGRIGQCIDRAADQPRHQDAEAVGHDNEPEPGHDAGPVRAYKREDTAQC